MKVARIRGSIVGIHDLPNITQRDIDRLTCSNLRLEPEPNNPDDPNTVKCKVGNKHIGYIDREAAAQITPLLKSGTKCSSNIIQKYDESILIDLYFTSENGVRVSPKIDSTSRPARNSHETNVIKPKVVHMKEATIRGAIVGMRYRPQVTQWDINNLSSSQVRLLREPDNRHDRNAVKCIVKGKHFGYVNREAAAQVSPLLKDGAEYSVKIIK